MIAANERTANNLHPMWDIQWKRTSGKYVGRESASYWRAATAQDAEDQFNRAYAGWRVALNVKLADGVR